jgi:GNAT superfamily N-acetyltransferase
VREATEADAAACRMLLPEFVGAGSWWVAAERQPPYRVVGAGALWTRCRPSATASGPGVGLEVISPCRRQGLGRSLLRAVVAQVRSEGHAGLYAARRVDLADASFPAWQALGFRVAETAVAHEVSVEALRARLGPLADWLRQRGAIPAAVGLQPLLRVSADAVVDLHTAHLGGDRDDLRRRVRGQGPNGFHPRYSQALLLGDRVIGCLLARRSGPQSAAVDAVIVAPDHRHAWANVLLKLETARAAAGLEVRHLQFTTFDQYDDTRKFADQLGGKILHTRALLYLPLSEAAS